MSEETNQVTTETGDQGHQQTQQQADVTQSLGWRAALPDEYKEHEDVKVYAKPGDFVKAALEIKTERDALNEKLSKAIFKPADDAPDEEMAAYRTAMGIPDKAEDYEVELVEGMDNSLADWFKQTALKIGLPKDAAKAVSQEWNTMITQMVKADAEAKEKAHNDAVTAQKNAWGNDVVANAETVKAAYQHVAKDVPALGELLQTELDINGKKILVGDLPGMMDVFLWIGKKIMDDTPLPGTSTEIKQSTGMIYDKSPAPPNGG